MITSDVKDYGDDLDKTDDSLDFPEIPDMKRGRSREWKYKSKDKTQTTYTSSKKTDANPDAKLDGIDLPQLKREGADKEWSYRRIRDLIALLHVGLFEYADRLSSYISYSTEFKGKYLKCRKRLNILIQELKNLVQDKIKLQELLKDLSSKYNMLEHALKKAGDINQDNKETIEKIRVNRDKCIQTIDNRNEVVASLRNQNSELRRHLATLRTSKFRVRDREQDRGRERGRDRERDRDRE
jgi:chromosome segregation ATPase